MLQFCGLFVESATSFVQPMKDLHFSTNVDILWYATYILTNNIRLFNNNCNLYIF